MIQAHYAVQVCDIASRSSDPRYCNKTKTEITEKCVSSFIHSVKYAAEKNKDCMHTIRLFDDHSSDHIKKFIARLISDHQCDNIKIESVELQTKGIMPSIRATYEWLESEGEHIVFQVQDDYLYTESAVYEMIDVLMQIYNELGDHIIVNPFHHHNQWLVSYRNRSTPRAVVMGAKRYWMQCYDIACTFMTTKEQFSKHWDLYEKFFELGPYYANLEPESLNKILVNRGVLCLMPINNISLHMQHELDKDPYFDWEELWNSVENL